MRLYPFFGLYCAIHVSKKRVKRWKSTTAIYRPHSSLRWPWSNSRSFSFDDKSTNCEIEIFLNENALSRAVEHLWRQNVTNETSHKSHNEDTWLTSRYTGRVITDFSVEKGWSDGPKTLVTRVSFQISVISSRVHHREKVTPPVSGVSKIWGLPVTRAKWAFNCFLN